MDSDGKQPQQQSLVESILDVNNDESVIDDIAGMVLGGSNQKKVVLEAYWVVSLENNTIIQFKKLHSLIS